MTDIIVIAVVAGILGAAGWYVHREKKRGHKCIGCPEGCCPSGGCGNGCGGCSCGNGSAK